MSYRQPEKYTYAWWKEQAQIARWQLEHNLPASAPTVKDKSADDFEQRTRARFDQLPDECKSWIRGDEDWESMSDLVYLDYGVKLLELCASDCPDLQRERVLAICRAVSEDGMTPHEVYNAIMNSLK